MDLGISPGDYIPEDITQTSCKNLCGFLGFDFSVVAGLSCFCRNVTLSPQLITDIGHCTFSCPGDKDEFCGNNTNAIQVKTTSCFETVDFDLGDFYRSAEVGQAVAVAIEAESNFVPIELDYGDGTPTLSQSVQQVRPHVYTIPGHYVVSALSSINGEVSTSHVLKGSQLVK